MNNCRYHLPAESNNKLHSRHTASRKIKTSVLRSNNLRNVALKAKAHPQSFTAQIDLSRHSLLFQPQRDNKIHNSPVTHEQSSGRSAGSLKSLSIQRNLVKIKKQIESSNNTFGHTSDALRTLLSLEQRMMARSQQRQSRKFIHSHIQNNHQGNQRGSAAISHKAIPYSHINLTISRNFRDENCNYMNLSLNSNQAYSEWQPDSNSLSKSIQEKLKMNNTIRSSVGSVCSRQGYGTVRNESRQSRRGIQLVQRKKQQHICKK